MDLRRVRQRNKPWKLRRSHEPKLPGQVGPSFRIRRGKSTRTVAVFRCRCRQYYVAETHKVKSGRTLSCGCVKAGRSNFMIKHPVVARSRRRVKSDFLEQIAPAFRAGPIGSALFAVFKCRCGKHVIQAQRHVVSGKVRGCGCRQRPASRKLVVECDYLMALRRVGVTVRLPLLDGNPGEMTSELQKIVGKKRCGQVVGLRYPIGSWSDDNLALITIAEHQRRQTVACMAALVSECERMAKRQDLRATAFTRGSHADRMESLIKAAGMIPTPWHRLAKIDESKDWVPGNVVWVCSPAVTELMLIDRRRLDKAKK